MFRLHKTKPVKSGERVDFKFSNFKAVQIPKGWDKLVVLIQSVETGKTITRCGKAAVRNGSCQWTETLTESIWISHDQNDSSKECPLKFVVSTGTGRSGILGEVIVDMATYMSSNAIVPISFPLKKCNHGTILQAKIQCLNPRAKLRDEESKETCSHKEDSNADSPNAEIKPEQSHNVDDSHKEESYSAEDLDSTLHQTQNGKEASSDSRHNYDSAEGSNNSSGDDRNLIGIQDSTSLQNSLAQRSYPVDSPSQSNHSSFKSRITLSDDFSQDDLGEVAAPSLKIPGSSKSMLEAAEDTIEQLHGEAKMWERNARKLMLELEILRKEYSEQSKNQVNLDMELSAACAERDGLQKEVERLKLLLEKSMEKPSALKDSALTGEGVTHVVKELENEIKFQKESNANLTLQLKRSQESNAELLSVLQELEETMKMQKDEIKNLSSLQSKVSDMENSFHVNLEKNKDLMLQIERLQESERNLQAQVQALEQALAQKNHNIPNGGLNNHALFNTESEYKQKLSNQEKEIVSLKVKLSMSPREMENVNGGDNNLIREIETLQLKLQELESDCQELTDENLELLLKLKETKNNSSYEAVDHESEMHNLEEKLRKKLLREIGNDHNRSIQEFENLKMGLEAKVTNLSVELSEKRAEMEGLEANLLSKEDEIENLQRYQRELEAKLNVVQKEKNQLEENIEIGIRESDIATKCLNDLRKDLMTLSSSMDSHVSANKTLERKSSELESGKWELECQLRDLRQENEALSACISDLQAQVNYLTDERDSTTLELENSRSHTAGLTNEIGQLRNEIEIQQMNEKKVQEMRKQLVEAQEECEYLRRVNSELEAAAENLMEKCSSLQNSNTEMKKEKIGLQGSCAHLEARLSESHKCFDDYVKKVKVLEEKISLMLEDSATKEKNFTSELDLLLKENDKLKEQFNLLNQMYLEKVVEVENLQQVSRDLAAQLSVTQEERERTANDSVHQVSGLRKVIATLESELNTIHREFDAKVQGLMDELASSQKNQEKMKASNERMSKMLSNYRSCEEDFKTTLNSLELKLTVSEYEKQQVTEEANNLKVQLLKIGTLQDEVLAMKSAVNSAKSDKAKVETSLQIISRECRELKAEKNSLIEEITTLKKTASELEDCKQKRIALEKKLQPMESDLIAKEALLEQDAELKNELRRIKRDNKQLQGKIHQLEQEKEKCQTRSQFLEEELISIKEKQQNQSEHTSAINSYNNQNGREVDNKKGGDPASKIQLLEDELAKATKTNNTYKVQIKRLMSEDRKSRTGSPRKSTAEGEVVPKEKFERTKSSLETELRDIRERYLLMSLKYAEVEAQREELVMKLKATNNKKRWL